MDFEMKDKLADVYESWYIRNEKRITMDIGWETWLLPESERFQEKARDMFCNELNQFINMGL